MNRALWFVGPRQVELRPFAYESIGHDDVLVRTMCSGVSAGTELLAYRGELPTELELDESLSSLTGNFTYPFRYGYSAVGEIEEIGAGVRDLVCGDVVFAFHPHQERFVCSAAELIPTAGLSPRLAVLLPYVETAVQVTLDAGSVFGDTVVVCGLGALGMLVGVLIQRAGGRVIAIEPQAWRRDVAANVGIDAVDPSEASQVVDSSQGVPLAIECSGNPAALSTALGLLSHEGTVLVASWYGSNDVKLPLGGSFHRRRLTIRSTQVSTIPASLSGRWTRRRRMEWARELATSLPLADLATHTIPFRRAADGYEQLDAGGVGVVHMAFGYD